MLDGEKSLELLKMAEGLKVILSILVRKTAGWLPILKKRLKLPENVQILVRSWTLRSLRRVLGVINKQIIIWIGNSSCNDIWGGRRRL